MHDGYARILFLRIVYGVPSQFITFIERPERRRIDTLIAALPEAKQGSPKGPLTTSANNDALSRAEAAVLTDDACITEAPSCRDTSSQAGICQIR